MPQCPKCRQENEEGTPLCRECGATLPTASAQEPTAGLSSEDAEVLELVRGGKKIQAIKLYRERHGVGLAEAKDAVEALAIGREPGSTEVATDIEAEVLALMRDQKKISAIKLYREHHQTGLKEAKDAVEALAAQHGIATQGPGCAGVVLLGIVGLAASAWRLLA